MQPKGSPTFADSERRTRASRPAGLLGAAASSTRNLGGPFSISANELFGAVVVFPIGSRTAECV
eukprot:12949298-Alexandrium_andersonii.AAC.1